MFDHLKGAAVSTILTAALLAIVLGIVSESPGYWWLWATVAIALFQLVMVVLYPVVIAPLFNTFEPLKDESLAGKVDAMARRAGLNPKGIFEMDAARRSGHSNAYFTGLGKSKRVVLFDTLVSSHTHEEILGVLAHELGHFKLRHIGKSFILGQVVLIASFYATYRLLNWDLVPQTFGYEPSSLVCGPVCSGGVLEKRQFLHSPRVRGSITAVRAAGRRLCVKARRECRASHHGSQTTRAG